MADLAEFQTKVGFRFLNPDLLRLAVTHPSVAYELGQPQQHNQRLEFLGDAVLQLVLTRVLYERFPSVGEGPLTKARAHLVNRGALAEQSRKLGLGEYLVLSRGEEMNQGRDRPSTLADAFEALLGAIFLDQGFAAAEIFILAQFKELFGELGELPNLENPKGDLQEVLQARSADGPQYRLVSVTGPDHERQFESVVVYRGEELGRGIGKNKKESESRAALQALENLKATRDQNRA